MNEWFTIYYIYIVLHIKVLLQFSVVFSTLFMKMVQKEYFGI